MSTFNMQNLSLLLIFSMTCLCWTRPSHALSVRQKLIELRTSVDQMRDRMDDTSRTEKINQITGTLDDVITASGCQANFTLFESSCYYFGERLSSHSGDQRYARAVCHMKGSDLVTIESKKEADFIKSHALRDIYITSAHKHRSIWRWDATGVDIAHFYSPWQSGQPNNASNLCAYIHGYSGKLYDYSCSRTGMRYICETKLPACA